MAVGQGSFLFIAIHLTINDVLTRHICARYSSNSFFLQQWLCKWPSLLKGHRSGCGITTLSFSGFTIFSFVLLFKSSSKQKFLNLFYSTTCCNRTCPYLLLACALESKNHTTIKHHFWFISKFVVLRLRPRTGSIVIISLPSLPLCLPLPPSLLSRFRYKSVDPIFPFLHLGVSFSVNLVLLQHDFRL